MRTANFKSVAITALLSMGLLTGCTNGITNQKTSNHMDTLNLTQEWDKKFPQSNKVNHRKVTFKNRYGITLAADLYEPKNIESKLPAIAVSGPFGAVKEQSSGLYAQTMAERGFLTLAFDPSYTGESGGEPRNVASPDINTEDFSAAVDFLTAHPDVDAERIGIIGICGFGGMGLNAAAMDTRIKATVASTMYNMSRVNANGYFDAEDSAEARRNKRETMNAIRTRDAQNGTATPGTPVCPPASRATSRNSSRTTSIITRLNVLSTPVPSIPTVHGTLRWLFRSSICHCCPISTRLTMPYCSFTAKMPIHVISAKMPSNASRATTRSY